MSVRKIIAGLAGATLVATTMSLTLAEPAGAEPTGGARADANDIVGVGSDTTQFAMAYVADGVERDGVYYPGYNQLVAPDPTDAQLISYDAFSEDVVDDCPEVPVGDRPAHPVAGRVVECLRLRTAEPLTWRPNGSGNGKRTLYQAMAGPGGTTVGGANGNPAVNFARSSAPVQAGAERDANLWAFPFAFDGFKPGVRKTGSNAPANITPQQFVDIYKGEITNWNQIGGQNGVIKPLVPQPGSGTYQVFNNSMTALNGGDAGWNTNPNAVFAQEHDDTLIKNDPNAIAPFSTGRAKVFFADTVQILAGSWSVDRALFNVVRNSDLDAQFVDDLFGSDGFLCSAAAQPLIEGSGFEQLAPPSLGGICGEPTQETPDPADLVTSPDRFTATTLAGASPGANKVRLTATVDKSVDGTVEFFEGETPVGSAPVATRQGVLNLSGVPAGSHTYTATFTPANADYGSSTSEQVTVSVANPIVKVAPKITESFPAKVKKGKKFKGTVTVASKPTATGTVKILLGKKKLAAGKLKGGKATFTLKLTKKGKQKLTINYSGSSKVKAAKKSFTVKVK